MTHLLRQLFFAVTALLIAAPVALAQDCKKEEFAAAVDQAGASLRKFNLENQPKLNAKLEALRAKKGWKKTDSEDKASEYLQDGRIAELDGQSNELLTKIDALGRSEEGKPVDCGKLGELKAAGVELLAVMKAKSSYTLEKIDLELQGGGAPPKQTATAPAPAAKTEAPKAEAPKATDSKLADVKIISKPSETKPAETKAQEAKPAESKPVETKRDPPKPAPIVTAERSSPQPNVRPLTEKETAEARAESEARRGRDVPSSSWQTSSEQAMNADPGGPGQPYGPPPTVTSEEESEGYSLDEIREATRGFFGTISTNLASVIEYSFAKSGRPTAYILGQEGGGAFLAGLRYGDGTLYFRKGTTQTQKVYWHGPSVGYDVGAEGSRTLFLIYKMHEPDELYRSFTGVDGSAYVVGGVGLTLLKGGPVIMAPIRSGIGLRLGANLGYLRFTPRPTWNPF